ncbi:MAG: hypothetical protein Q4F00_06490 [bacterium]|nr:hypothetical protein [bacterium]
MLVPAKCTSCGDIIQIDRAKDTAICPSCGSAFIVEKAVNNYGTIINAQTVEIHTDGITADNLLSIALEEARHQNYSKASEYITKARERGASHPIFRLGDDFLNEYTKKVSSALGAQRISTLLQLLRQAHTLRRDASQEEHHRKQIEEFYQLIEDFTYADITPARQAALKSLQHAHNYQELKDSFRSIYQLASCLEEFIVWGKQESYFTENTAEKLPPAKLGRNWAREIMECLRELSLCYFADNPKQTDNDENKEKKDVPQSAQYVLSPAEAQNLYAMAERIYPLAAYPPNQPLEQRLISPAQGGEGVHTHRLKTGSESAEQSVSDRVYFSSQIEQLPEIRRNPSIGSGLLWGGCSTAAALAIVWPVTYLVWMLASAIFGDSFGLCYAISALGLAVVGFIGLIMYEGGYSGELDTYEYKKLFEEWKNSPAHGANKQDFAFKDFVEALDPQASVMLKQKAAALLNENSRFGWVYSNVLKRSKNTADSDDRIVSGKGALLVLIAVLITAYFTAMCWCADATAPNSESTPAAAASTEQPSSGTAE